MPFDICIVMQQPKALRLVLSCFFHPLFVFLQLACTRAGATAGQVADPVL
jgi:hypothetical protein